MNSITVSPWCKQSAIKSSRKPFFTHHWPEQNCPVTAATLQIITHALPPLFKRVARACVRNSAQPCFLPGTPWHTRAVLVTQRWWVPKGLSKLQPEVEVCANHRIGPERWRSIPLTSREPIVFFLTLCFPPWARVALLSGNNEDLTSLPRVSLSSRDRAD